MDKLDYSFLDFLALCVCVCVCSERERALHLKSTRSNLNLKSTKASSFDYKKPTECRHFPMIARICTSYIYTKDNDICSTHHSQKKK